MTLIITRRMMASAALLVSSLMAACGPHSTNPDYPGNAAEFDAGQPVVRAILGGTGKYMGARGQLISTRNADGSYAQVFTLVR